MPQREPYEIEIPDWHPAFINAYLRMTPMARHSSKKKAAKMLGDWKFICRVPDAVVPRYVTVEFYGWPSGRLPDPDNVWKELRDAMKIAHLIVDDAPEWATFSDPLFVRSERKATVITLVDAPARALKRERRGKA